jgi:hypothetical protein
MQKGIRLLILFYFLFELIPTKSQNLNEFEGLKSYGFIPEDFRKLSGDEWVKKYHFENNGQPNEKAYNEYINYLFRVDNILSSGKVLFNDPLSRVLETVADHLMKDFPELRKQLKFFIINSSEANAWSTENGIVFFSTALFAKIQNEAQIAYIIAHEASHYNLFHHAIHFKQSKTENTGEKTKEFMNAFSLALEEEADADALLMLQKAGYKTDAGIEVLDIIQFGKYQSQVTDLDFLKSMPYQFDFNSNLSTRIHQPNFEEVSTDLAVRQDKIRKFKKADGKNFIIYPKDFLQKLAHTAGFQLINTLLSERKYFSSLNLTWYLQQFYNSNKHLKIAQAKALYALATYKNVGLLSQITENDNSIKLPFQEIALQKSKETINIWALHYVWRMHKEYANYPFLKIMSNHLTAQLIHINKFSVKKVESLRRKQHDNIPTAHHLLFEMFEKEYFKETFYQIANLSEFNLQSTENKHNTNAKIMFIDPYIRRIEISNNNKYELSYQNRNAEQKLHRNLIRYAQENKLEVELFETKYFGINQTERYNDYSTMINWLDEKINHKEVFIYPSNHDDILKLNNKYNCERLAIVGINELIEKQEGNKRFIWNNFKKNVLHSGFYFMVFDTEINTLVFSEKKNRAEKLHKSRLEEAIQNALESYTSGM